MYLILYYFQEPYPSLFALITCSEQVSSDVINLMMKLMSKLWSMNIRVYFIYKQCDCNTNEHNIRTLRYICEQCHIQFLINVDNDLTMSVSNIPEKKLESSLSYDFVISTFATYLEKIKKRSLEKVVRPLKSLSFKSEPQKVIINSYGKNPKNLSYRVEANIKDKLPYVKTNIIVLVVPLTYEDVHKISEYINKDDCDKIPKAKDKKNIAINDWIIDNINELKSNKEEKECLVLYSEVNDLFDILIQYFNYFFINKNLTRRIRILLRIILIIILIILLII